MSEGRTSRFFAIALGFTLVLQLPVVLAKYGVIAASIESVMPLAALGGFGPLIGAILAARREPGGVRALFRRALIWRVGAVWYVVALGGLALTHVCAAAVYGLLGGTDVAWLYLPPDAQRIGAMILVPIVEEIGWRGYALPRLQQRHGALKATLLLGVAWAAWHTMMFLFASPTPVAFIVAVVNILVGSVIFTCFFNRTRGSLLLAILLHVGAHLCNPSHAFPNVTPMIVYTAGLAVLAGALLLVDRAAWRVRDPSV